MDKQILIEGIRKLEEQIAERLNRINQTSDKLRRFIEPETSNKEKLNVLFNLLQKETIYLRDLYQTMIFKTALLAKLEETKDIRLN
jgi:hypothetical protein